MARLAELIDPKSLDASEGSRAVLRVETPAAWLEEGCELEVAAPAKLVCARCGGGGCDGCGRSGALAAPEDPADRVVRATLPAGSGEGAALRLVRPFGEGGSIEQLILEVRPGIELQGSTSGAASLVRVSTRAEMIGEHADVQALANASRVRRALFFAMTLAAFGTLVWHFFGRG